MAEAVLLAILPRAPSAYDPVRHLDAALQRRDHVLALLVRRNLLSTDEAERARLQPMTAADFELRQPVSIAPHFTDWVIAELPPEVRDRGGIVRTTLDARLQRQLETRAKEHVAGLRDRSLGEAGVVVLQFLVGLVWAALGYSLRR
jgi:membrane carboxypeptidase/penicillin-binding protein PbpC